MEFNVNELIVLKEAIKNLFIEFERIVYNYHLENGTNENDKTKEYDAIIDDLRNKMKKYRPF